MAWAATEAKAKFSEVLDRAEAEGPQRILRRKREYLVMTKAEYDAASKVTRLLRDKKPVPAKYQNLADFFRNSPLAGTNIERARPRLKPRHIDL